LCSRCHFPFYSCSLLSKWLHNFKGTRGEVLKMRPLRNENLLKISASEFITALLTPWCNVFLEKLILSQSSNSLLQESEDSLPYSQRPATVPYHKPESQTLKFKIVTITDTRPNLIIGFLNRTHSEVVFW